MLGAVARSIAVDGNITESAASFLNKQTDIGQKKERLNELLIQINSAIEFAKAHEPIQNIWLRRWLEDLQNASRDGEKVQSAFKEQTASGKKTMNPLEVTARLCQRSKNVNRLNDAVMRLERKASGCKEFLRRLRYDFNEQRHQTCIRRMGKLEKKVKRLRNCLRSLKLDGKFKNHKKTKLLHQARKPENTSVIFSQPEILQNWNHDETENIKDKISEQEIRQQDEHVPIEKIPIPKWDRDHDYTDIFDRSRKQLRRSDSATTDLEPPPRAYSKASKPGNSKHKEHVSIETITMFGEWEAASEGDHHYTLVFDQCRKVQRSDSATNNQKPLSTVHAKASKSGNNKHKKNFIRSFFGLFRCIFPVLSSSMSTQD